MDQPAVSNAALVAAAAAVATVVALSWAAAEGGRGLDATDFRTLVIVTLGVWLGGHALRRTSL